MDNERNWKRTLLAVVDTVTQPLFAVLISFLLGAVVILVIGKNPLLAYGEMIRGAFGKQVYLMNTLTRATPIIMGGLAVCMAWRSGYEAMGGEGQMILGAVAAALVGYYLPVPGWLRIPAAMLAAAAAGAVYSAFSGWLFEKFDVTFVISTLMMNYIANYFAAYLCNYPLRDPEANVYQMQNAQTGKLPAEATLPPIMKGWVHWGFVLAVAAVLVTWFLFKKTSFGYKSRMGGTPREDVENVHRRRIRRNERGSRTACSAHRRQNLPRRCENVRQCEYFPRSRGRHRHDQAPPRQSAHSADHGCAPRIPRVGR